MTDYKIPPQLEVSLLKYIPSTSSRREASFYCCCCHVFCRRAFLFSHAGTTFAQEEFSVFKLWIFIFFLLLLMTRPCPSLSFCFGVRTSFQFRMTPRLSSGNSFVVMSLISKTRWGDSEDWETRFSTITRSGLSRQMVEDTTNEKKK